jgi:hypothetical protein
MKRPFSEVLIRAATALIPAKMLRKRLRSSLLTAARKKRILGVLPAVRENQRRALLACRRLLASGRRPKVAFLVCDASMFTAEPVFEKMRSDPAYDCFIAVVPRFTNAGGSVKDRFAGSQAYFRENLKKTFTGLQARYGGNVRRFFDAETGRAESLEGEADIVFTSIIYEDQTCAEFTVEAMSRYALVALTSYSYSGLFKYNLEHSIFLPNIVFAWKFFVSDPYTLELWTAANPCLKENIELSGYVKMDRLAEFAGREKPPRKKIIIAPHHTLTKDTDGLNLSNFLRLSDFFLRLPTLYPEVDFVFRPHPLLFPRLSTGRWWGEDRTRRYREAMAAHPNVEFQQGGDYFETFARSDALIHDCGSFLAEYFYTSRPQCYILEKGAEKQFLPFGRRLLEHVYISREERDILKFIDNVVLAGNDSMEADRKRFAETSVCCYYPHAADRILQTVSATLRKLRED